MRIKSIRIRLTAWYVGLLTLSLVLLGGAGWGLLSYSLHREVDNALTSVGKVLGERVHGGDQASFPGDLDDIFRRFFGFLPVERYFEMLDPRGHREPGQPQQHSLNLPVSREALLNAARGLPTFETMDGAGDYPVRILTVPVMEGGRLGRVIQVGMSLRSVSEALTRFVLVMAGLFPVVFLLSAAGGWLLARRALRPIDRMTRAARRIGAEHLAERIEETGTGDELDELAKTLNQMLGRLDVAFSQIRQFTANASHELQTPLTIIRGEMEVALRSKRTPEEYEETLRSAIEETERIGRLVDGLLLMARSEAGVLRMDRRRIDLEGLAEEVVDRLRSMAEERAVELRLVPPESGPVEVDGDRDHLSRLVSNLVENGLKYTRPGGRVVVSFVREEGRILLHVADTGVGIREEDRDKIFQPFYRSPEVLPERGEGLGLSIARSIAVAHGGGLRVESMPGGTGSVFTLDLPG